MQKTYCHLLARYGCRIPNDEINMDYMTLSQAEHSDREHGFIASRMLLPRKIVAVFWQDQPVLEELAGWMRSAVG